MGISYGTGSIVRDGLVLHLDAVNTKSYPGTGLVWNDISGNSNNFTLDATGFDYNAGVFDLTNGGMSHTGTITTSATCTCVFWIKTTDEQALMWQGTTTAYYLGAYRVANKNYNANTSSTSLHRNGVQVANIYDFLPDGTWQMFELKGCNFSGLEWTSWHFSQYAVYEFSSTSIASIMIYDKNLSLEESLQNFNSRRERYGI